MRKQTFLFFFFSLLLLLSTPFGYAASSSANGHSITVSISPNPVPVGDSTTATATCTCDATATSKCVKDPWTSTGPLKKDGWTATGKPTTATTTPHAISVNCNSATDSAELTVVGVKEINSPANDSFIGMNDGESANISCSATTQPAGHESMIQWSVSPTDGVAPATGSGASFSFKATKPAKYTVKAKVGTSEKTTAVTVYRVQLAANYDVIRAVSTKIEATYEPSSLGLGWQYEWTFTGGKGGTKTTSTKSTSVTLVDGDGEYKVSVKLSKSGNGSSTSKSATLTVKQRTGWDSQIPIACAQDNRSSWGEMAPITTSGGVLGMNRDRTSGQNAQIVPSPIQGASKKWESGYGRKEVSDTNGPNDGYYYVDSCNVKMDRETVINRYIKARGPAPARRSDNFYKTNSSISSGILAGVKGHEYKGHNGGTGHQGLKEKAMEENENNVRYLLEKEFAKTEAELITSVNRVLQGVDLRVRAASADPLPRGNFDVPNVLLWRAADKTWINNAIGWKG